MNPLVVGDYGTWAIKIFFVVTNYVFGYFKKIIQVLIIVFFFFFELRQKEVIKTILGSEINQNL